MTKKEKTKKTPAAATATATGTATGTAAATAAPGNLQGLRIQGLKDPEGKTQDLIFSQDKLQFLLSENSRLSEQLLASLHSESQSHLSALLAEELKQPQKLLSWETLHGLKPVLRLSPASYLQSKETLGSFLKLEAKLDQLILTQGGPVCGKSPCGTYRVSLKETAEKALEALGSEPHARNLILAVEHHFSPKKRLESLIAQAEQAAETGSLRFVYEGEYFKLDDSSGIPQGLSAKDVSRLEALLVTAKTKNSFYSLLTILSGKQNPDSLKEALTLAHQQSPVLELLLQKDDRTLKAIGKSFSGYACTLCDKVFPPLAPSEPSEETREYNHLRKSEWLNLPLSELLKKEPSFKEELEPFLSSGLAHLRLNQPLSELSTGERSLLVLLDGLINDYEELLLLGSHLFQGLDRQGKAVAFSLLESLRKRGNLLLLVDREEAMQLESDLHQSGSPDHQTSSIKLPTKAGLTLLFGENSSGKTSTLKRLTQEASGKKSGRKPLYFNAEEELLRYRSRGKERALEALGLPEPLAVLFATLPQARKLGLGEGDLRLDRAATLCPRCQGLGRLSQSDLPEADWPHCPSCLGFSLNEKASEISFHGKTISDLFAMKLGELLPLFQLHESLRARLSRAHLLGLGSLRGGELLENLSDDELLRLLLARAFSSLTPAKSLIFLDETLDRLSMSSQEALLENLLEQVHLGASVLLSTRRKNLLQSSKLASQPAWVSLPPKKAFSERGSVSTEQGMNHLKSTLQIARIFF